MKHDLSLRMRVQILSELNTKPVDISNYVGKPLSFVQRWIHRDTIERVSGSGRPLKTTRSVLAQIKNRMVMKKRRSTRLIARQMHLSQSTITRSAHQLGLRAYHPRKKPLLTEAHKRARRRFARAHKYDDWHRVLFTDEKKVTIIQSPIRKNDVIWAPIGTVLSPTQIAAHAIQLNVSAAVCFSGKSSIHIFEETMNSNIYSDILKKYIIPTGNKLLGSNWKLFSDNDPKHKSKKCMNIFHKSHQTTRQPSQLT